MNEADRILSLVRSAVVWWKAMNKNERDQIRNRQAVSMIDSGFSVEEGILAIGPAMIDALARGDITIGKVTVDATEVDAIGGA